MKERRLLIAFAAAAVAFQLQPLGGFDCVRHIAVMQRYDNYRTDGTPTGIAPEDLSLCELQETKEYIIYSTTPPYEDGEQLPLSRFQAEEEKKKEMSWDMLRNLGIEILPEGAESPPRSSTSRPKPSANH
jgi:hypothetical protein